MRGVERRRWESVGAVEMSRRRDGARHACIPQSLPPGTPRMSARLSWRLCEFSCRVAVDGRKFASDYKRPVTGGEKEQMQTTGQWCQARPPLQC
eukprot:5658369-Lingulodinium_polyedra.AAC.1